MKNPGSSDHLKQEKDALSFPAWIICELVIGDLSLQVDRAPLPSVGHLAGVRDVHLTSLVHVHMAGVTFHPLTHQPVQHGATVITEGGPSVSAGFERVLAPGVIRARSLIRTFTRSSNRLMAPLVDREMAPLALVALFANPPDEVAALAAEGGLPEDVGGEFVVFHLVHFLPPQRPSVGRGTVSHGPSRTLLAWVGEQEGGRTEGAGRRQRSTQGVAARYRLRAPAGSDRSGTGAWAAHRLSRRPGAQ